MENPNGEKSDGLEIISIGTLYEGCSWDKKYWSSSRGKDRYPYPVGYHAVRIRGGITYRMETQEGPNGPLFLIYSTDGELCTGQTPDIAWERFHKKGGPRAKLGHGKRFSCKIDGTELFGFKNPLVQRLLRELVANVNGTANRSSICPSTCNGDFDLEPVNQGPESCVCPDVVQRPVKLRSNRKRKINHGTQTINSVCSGTKRLQNADLSNVVEVSCNRMEDGMRNSEIGLTSIADRDGLAHKESKSLPVSMDMVRYVEQGNCPLSANEDIFLEYSKPSDSFGVNHLSQQEHKDATPKDSELTSPDNILSQREKHIDRSLSVEIEGCNSFEATEGSSGETMDSIESKIGKDIGISASGTWNLQQVKSRDHADHVVNSAPDCCKVCPSLVESDLSASNRMIAEEMSTSLCSQKELEQHISNVSPERIDFDSEGQDLANSMMKVLLPQAVTLLKKASSESKELFHISEIPFTSKDPSFNLAGMKSPEKAGEIHPTEVLSHGKLGVTTPSEGSFEKRETNMHVLDRTLDFDVQSFEVVESVVPDSLDDEQLGNNVNDQRLLCSKLVEVGELTFDKKKCYSDCLSFLGCADTHKEFLNFLSRTSRNNNTCYDISSQSVNNKPEKDEVLTSDSPTGYSSSKKEAFLEGKLKDASSDWDDRQSYTVVNSKMDNSKKRDAGIVNDPTKGIPATEPNFSMPHEAQSSHSAMVGCELLNSNLPNGTSHSHTGFQMETAFSSKVALLSSVTTYSDQAVTPKSMKNVETTTNENLETGVVQYRRRQRHSKGPKLQNGIIDWNQTNYNTSDTCDDIDTNKVSGEKYTKETSSMCTASAVNNSEKEANAINGGTSRAGDASSLMQCPDFPPMVMFDSHLSESIICRNREGDCLPEPYPANESFIATEVVQAGALHNTLDREVSSGSGVKLEEHREGLKNRIVRHKGMSTGSTSAETMVVDGTKDKVMSSFGDPFMSHVEKHQNNAGIELSGPCDLSNYNYNSTLCQERKLSLCDVNRHDTKDITADLNRPLLLKSVSNSAQDCSNLLPHSKVHQESLLMDQISPGMESKQETEGHVELVGCYKHPTPVLSILLTTHGDDIHIAVLCGLLEERSRTIFMYSIPTKKQRGGCPSFIGYTMIMPIMQDAFCKIESGTSALQFTPDLQCLVLPSSMKAPSCRKGSIDCLCSLCTSNCFGENALRVVHVKLGYVSLVAKLTTAENVHCALVCEPNHLVAVEESGRLHAWVMHTNWSAFLEEFVLPNLDHSFHRIVELKRIPKSTPLIIGHNGAGDFGVWDLSKRMILSRFSAPGKSIFQVLPVGLCSSDDKGHVPTRTDVEDRIKGIMATTKLCFLNSSEELASLFSQWRDLAVWLLVSVGCDSEVQPNHEDTGINRSPEGCWRLALLVKNSVIFGSTLDPRVTAMNVSAGQAIIGTSCGHLCMWEVSTGRKLTDLHYFQGKRVSCIASDSQSGLVAVAGEDCKLLIFSTRGE